VYTQQELEESGLLDFRVFLYYLWKFLGLPEPTPIQLDIAYYLQHGPSRLMVQAFRGVGKSWITAAFVLWSLFLNPQWKIMVTSANQKRADDFSIFCKQLIDECPLLHFLKPDPEQRTSNIAFDVRPALPDQSPSTKSVGITGQLTGSRADLVVADDVEVLKNSYTITMREKIAELVKEFGDVLKPNGRIVYLGTPQVEDSLYNKLPDRGYEIRVWPAEIPQQVDRYKGRLGPYIKKLILQGTPEGTPTEPRRFPEEELRDRMAEHGRSGYALQYMLDTTPTDIERHPLKLHDLITTTLDEDMAHAKYMWSNDPTHYIRTLQSGGFDGDYHFGPGWKSEEVLPYSGTVMAIDPSGTGQDETAFAIVRFLHGQLFLVDVGGYKSGYSEETLQSLAYHAVKHKVNNVIIEQNFGGGMFGQLFKPVLARACKADARYDKYGNTDDPEGGIIEEVHHSGPKEWRILDAMEPVVQNHKLLIDARVVERDLHVLEERPRYSFIYQFTRMTRERGALPHEDRLEAVSMAVKYWVDYMAQDVDEALEQYQDDVLDEELARFVENAHFPGKPLYGKGFDTWVPLRNQ
jgi:hypothetical protein